MTKKKAKITLDKLKKKYQNNQDVQNAFILTVNNDSWVKFGE
jgi:hypothetical protein